MSSSNTAQRTRALARLAVELGANVTEGQDVVVDVEAEVGADAVRARLETDRQRG